MRSFEISGFTETMRKGMAMTKVPLNSKELLEVYNLMAGKEALVPYEPLVNLNLATDVSGIELDANVVAQDTENIAYEDTSNIEVVEGGEDEY